MSSPSLSELWYGLLMQSNHNMNFLDTLNFPQDLDIDYLKKYFIEYQNEIIPLRILSLFF